MISTEKGILPGSDYYVYTPSAQAQSLFFYPLIIGNFSYSDDYSLRRTAFDNFLLMYIKRGECIIELNDQVFRALPGQIVSSMMPPETASGCSWSRLTKSSVSMLTM